MCRCSPPAAAGGGAGGGGGRGRAGGGGRGGGGGAGPPGPAPKNRALDHFRHSKLIETKHQEIGREMEEGFTPDFDAALENDIGDDLLRLIFTACHPVLSTEARAALTLKLLCGLTTDEIARAFLVPEPTVAQRIVRAKRTLSEARVPFEVPRDEDLAARLSSVLEVI